MSSSSATLNGSGAEADSEPDEYCPICDDARWLNVDAPVGSPDFGKVIPCECQDRVWGSRVSTRLRDYSDLGALERMTFEATEPAGRPGLVDASSFRRAKEAAQTYSHDPMGWLVITGPSGTGKTHLAAAIANRLIATERPAKFVGVPALLDHMRSAMDDDAVDDFESFFESVADAPMLVLDDLGVQSPTPWAEEKLDQLLTHRYARRLPTVITISGDIDQLGERLRTRLRDPFISHIVELHSSPGNADRSIVGLDSAMLEAMTFDTFDPRGAPDTSRLQREQLHMAWQATRRFGEEPDRWLYLSGPTGVGKTHLAVAIANVQLSLGRSVLFRFVPDLLDDLRRAYGPGGGTSFDRAFDVIKNAEVLILDDLGSQASTAWAEEKLYQVIVHRHDSRLPTVITSRVLLDEPAVYGFTTRYSAPIASRLRDSMVVSEYYMNAPDYRHRGAPEARMQPPKDRERRNRAS